MIPDPMGIAGWHGEDQSAHVHREAPLDFIGPIPSSNGMVKSPVSQDHGVKKEVVATIIPKPSNKRETTSPDVSSIIARSGEYPKEVTFLEITELNSVVMQALVSVHIVKAVDSCVIKGIKEEGVKRKRNRAVYLDLTNSSSESETDSNNVSLLLDTPSFNAKKK